MKRKFVAPLIALLLCVSMIGVGFAGWMITASTKADAAGNFVVHTVDDYRLKFSATATDVVFGKPSSAAADSSKWLQYDNTVAQEDLTPTITLTFTELDLNKFAGKTITFTVGTIKYSGANITAALTNKYVWVKTTANDDLLEVKMIVAQDKSVTVKVGSQTDDDAFNSTNKTLTFDLDSSYFKWGEATNQQNPYTYFGTGDGKGVDDPFTETHFTDSNNAFASDITNGDAALQILQGIASFVRPNPSQSITGDSFSTTITCTIS